METNHGHMGGPGHHMDGHHMDGHHMNGHHMDGHHMDGHQGHMGGQRGPMGGGSYPSDHPPPPGPPPPGPPGAMIMRTPGGGGGHPHQGGPGGPQGSFQQQPQQRQQQGFATRGGPNNNNNMNGMNRRLSGPMSAECPMMMRQRPPVNGPSRRDSSDFGHAGPAVHRLPPRTSDGVFVLIESLSQGTDQDALHRFLDGLGCGPIYSTRILQKQGSAYVEASPAAHDALCAMGEAAAGALSMKFTAASDRLWIGNMPQNEDPEAVRRALAQAVPNVVEVQVPVTQGRGTKAFAYLTFRTVEEAMWVLVERQGMVIMGNPARIEGAGPRKTSGKGKGGKCSKGDPGGLPNRRGSTGPDGPGGPGGFPNRRGSNGPDNPGGPGGFPNRRGSGGFGHPGMGPRGPLPQGHPQLHPDVDPGGPRPMDRGMHPRGPFLMDGSRPRVSPMIGGRGRGRGGRGWRGPGRGGPMPGRGRGSW